MANVPPQTSTAGHTDRNPRHPLIVATSHAGTSSETNGSCRPAMTPSVNAGMSVTADSVKIGVPIAPNATGAVFAISESPETTEARVLAAALTEDVSTELSRFRQLALVARTRMAPLAKEPIDLDAIARETAARLVLSGSVRTLPGRARVSAALFDTSSGNCAADGAGASGACCGRPAAAGHYSSGAWGKLVFGM